VSLSNMISPMSGPNANADGTGPKKDGHYEGKNQHVFIDLRIDEKVCGVISGDIFRTASEGNSYVASFRTAPGVRIQRSQKSWTLVGQDEHGGRTIGTLHLLCKDDENKLKGSLTFNKALHSLPVRAPIEFEATYTSDAMRTLGLEWEEEKGIAAPTYYVHNGRQITVETALKDAGLRVKYVGQRSEIPTNGDGWGTSQLHTLMQDFAQASLSKRAWELHVLMLSRSTRRGLLGVMFDSQDQLPRQGAAIFASEIRRIPGISHERKLIQTTIHELGHALNLAHRFERVVGRADSNSFMNYDWRYKGGNQRDQFWKDFAFTFDHDELEFLRHAPLPSLIPGGAAFHSVHYWSDGNGGYSPYIPETELSGFTLELKPPGHGPVFHFAQPVFLQATLTNTRSDAVSLPPKVLDPKAGFLEVLIKRRRGRSTGSLEYAQPFVPAMTRCYDMDQPKFLKLQPGESYSDNLNLTYGSAGFTFAEPGEYDIIILLAFYDRDNRREQVVRSKPLRIRVATPKVHDEEREAMVLFREDVGLYMALGGSDGLTKAQDDLAEVRERRLHRNPDGRDPIVTNITRCEGINIGRPFIRYQDKRFQKRHGDRARAAALLSSLDEQALLAFDPHTAEGTRRLAQKHLKASK